MTKLDQAKFNEVYGLSGVKPTEPMDLNPVGNIGLVPDNANGPVSPSAFRPGQAVSDLTFVSGYSQRRIRITMNPFDTPVQAAGSIAIINRDNVIIWSTGDVDFNFIEHIQPELNEIGIVPGALQVITTAPTTSGPTIDFSVWTDGGFNPGVRIVNQGNAIGLSIESNGDVPLALANTAAILTDFYPMIKSTFGSSVVIYFGDGTDPTGVLSGSSGDVCLNASATGQIAYCSGGTVWTFA